MAGHNACLSLRERREALHALARGMGAFGKAAERAAFNTWVEMAGARGMLMSRARSGT